MPRIGPTAETEAKELAKLYGPVNKRASHRARVVHNILRTQGLVEYGISALDAIQRAIDDTTLDYLLLNDRITRDIEEPEDPNDTPADALPEHPLYEAMCRTREAMVRYSTFAIQYQLAERQLKLGEARIALLAAALKDTLKALGIDDETIRQVPRMLIETIERKEAYKVGDHFKAEAVAEILDQNAEVVIEDDEQFELRRQMHSKAQDNKKRKT